MYDDVMIDKRKARIICFQNALAWYIFCFIFLVIMRLSFIILYKEDNQNSFGIYLSQAIIELVCYLAALFFSIKGRRDSVFMYSKIAMLLLLIGALVSIGLDIWIDIINQSNSLVSDSIIFVLIAVIIFFVIKEMHTSYDLTSVKVLHIISVTLFVLGILEFFLIGLMVIIAAPKLSLSAIYLVLNSILALLMDFVSTSLLFLFYPNTIEADYDLSLEEDKIDEDETIEDITSDENSHI